jgi:hypothetical protein
MLSIKGMYDGNVIVPLTRINKRANTLVIITFFEEDLPTDESNVIKDVEEKYQTLSKSYNFGATPDDDYARELMEVYQETFPKTKNK